jgi:hypothetical protein
MYRVGSWLHVAVSPWATIESESEGETLRIHTLISDSLTKLPPVAAAYRICIAAECIASTTDAFTERRVVKQSLIHPYHLTHISWWILQSSFLNYNRHQINANMSHGRSGAGGEIMTCDGAEKRKEAKESEANHVLLALCLLPSPALRFAHSLVVHRLLETTV